MCSFAEILLTTIERQFIGGAKCAPISWARLPHFIIRSLVNAVYCALVLVRNEQGIWINHSSAVSCTTGLQGIEKANEEPCGSFVVAHIRP